MGSKRRSVISTQFNLLLGVWEEGTLACREALDVIQGSIEETFPARAILVVWLPDKHLSQSTIAKTESLERSGAAFKEITNVLQALDQLVSQIHIHLFHLSGGQTLLQNLGLFSKYLRHQGRGHHRSNPDPAMVQIEWVTDSAQKSAGSFKRGDSGITADLFNLKKGGIHHRRQGPLLQMGLPNRVTYRKPLQNYGHFPSL